MWNWINCYLSGRHDFGVTCSSGSVFLRCNHCGKRSNGWAVHAGQKMLAAVARPANLTPATSVSAPLPFVPRHAAQSQRSA